MPMHFSSYYMTLLYYVLNFLSYLKFLFIFSFLNPCSVIVVLHFSPLLSPALSHPTPIVKSPTNVVHAHKSSIFVPWHVPSPFFSHYFPSPLPSGHCPFVLYFQVFILKESDQWSQMPRRS